MSEIAAIERQILHGLLVNDGAELGSGSFDVDGRRFNRNRFVELSRPTSVKFKVAVWLTLNRTGCWVWVLKPGLVIFNSVDSRLDIDKNIITCRIAYAVSRDGGIEVRQSDGGAFDQLRRWNLLRCH